MSRPRKVLGLRERSAWTGVIPYLPPLTVVGSTWSAISPTPAIADHFQFWAAGHLVARGMSPYDPAAWQLIAAYGPVPGGIAVNTIADGPALHFFWLYPPQTAFLFAPFGALPLDAGIPLLHLFVLASALFALILVARAAGLTGLRQALFYTLATASLPFMASVADGQPVGLVLAGSVLVFVGAWRRSWWRIAAGAALISVKPHVVVPFAVAGIAFLVMRRDWRSLLVATAAILVVTIPAELVTPFPPVPLADVLGERSGLQLVTADTLARDLQGGPLVALLARVIAVALASIAIIRAPARHRALVGLAAGLGLSCALIPYGHEFDQMLVLPIVAVLLAMGRGSRHELGYAALAVLVVIVPWADVLWARAAGAADYVYQVGTLGAVPLLALLALGVASWSARASEHAMPVRDAT